MPMPIPMKSCALASPLAAWDRNDLAGTLSFGFHEVTGQTDLIKRVTIRNYSNSPITLRSEASGKSEVYHK